jgi:hypothetical protein
VSHGFGLSLHSRVLPSAREGALSLETVAPPVPRTGRGSGWFALCLVVALPAFAHKGSDAYWTLRADGPHLSGRYDVALRDLALVQALDANADRSVTWGELRATEGALCERLTRHLQLRQQGAPCALRCTGLQVVEHSDGRYASSSLDGECPAEVTSLDVTYSMLFDVDGEHRGLLSLTGEQGGHWEAFSTDTRTRQVTFERVAQSAQAGHAFAQGVHHIAIGWDHLCFLFALLLPSVLRREGTRWAPREGLRTTLGDVTKVVTAFTLAHSVTLALAAFEVVHPNGKWVEVAIALSVALAALNNLVPFVPDTRWSLAFALGLLHGFGFVSAIQDLGASARALWVSVLGFNLGVEAGQLAIVGAFVPLAWLVRARPAYVKVLLPLGSALILGVALFWTTERL